MADNAMMVQNIGQYNEDFRRNAQDFSRGPSTNRSCNDKCCYILFILMTIAFIATGAYFISKANVSDYLKDQDQATTTSNNSSYKIENLKPAVPVILGMIGLAVVLSIIFLCLLIKFPKCMFYTMLAIAAILMVAMMIIMFASGSIIGGIIFLVLLLLLACFLYCSRDKIEVGITLLNAASRFLEEKPTVFLAPLFMLIFVIIFEVFWVASLVGIVLSDESAAQTSQSTANQENTASSGTSALVLLWSFFHIFYSTFFYYCLVFLIATACALWYFNLDQNYLFTGMKRIIKFHVGSFTFAAILVTIVTMLRQAAKENSEESSGAAAICWCLVACCLKMIEDLLEVLNHNSIIVMSVTGQSYIDSAKSTISLIFDNYTLFIIVDIINTIVSLSGILMICGIPSVIGYFLLKQTAENPDDTTYLTIGLIAIILTSILIGSLFLSVLSEALSCIFIFYCFDKKFQEMGFQVSKEVPYPMRELFEYMNPYVSGNNNQNYGNQNHGNQNYGNQNYGGNNGGNPYGNNGGYY